MTKPPDLPPEQEAVRRLLADARHDGPTPPDVVARLDATLAALATEREPAPTPSTTTYSAPVVDLGARRRRVASMGLLAAAAVVVAGVALSQGNPAADDGASAGSAADSDLGTSQREFSGEAGSGDANEDGLGSGALKSTAPAPTAAYPTLSSDASDLDDQLLSLRFGSDAAQAPEASMSTEALAECDLGGTGRGRRVLAQIDGMGGAVVFRRADGATQQVDLYVCGDPTAVRTLTLPAP